MPSSYLILITLCLVGSAFFSATETAFSGMNRIRLKNLAKDGNKKAALALELEERYDKLLSTILVGNNIVNILATSLAAVFFTAILGEYGVSVSTAVMTVLVLLIGEIGPKILAKQRAEKFAMFSAGIIRFIGVLLSPITFLTGLWQKLLGKIFKNEAAEAMSEEELITIVEEAEQDGSLDEHESRLIRSAIEFNEQEVGEIFTPRVNMVAVDENAEADEVEQLFHGQGYSRLPVYKGTVDNVVGVIHEKDFYHQRYMGSTNWREGITPVIITTPSAEVSALLRRLQRGKNHMAVVVDEFGGTMGIVTLEDILEQLVGEIWDEHDEVEQNIRALPGCKYAVKGGCAFAEFNGYFRLDIDHDEYDAQTVSGFVTEHLARIPAEGDTFDAFGQRIKVTKADERRVLEILVEAAPSEQPEVG